MVFGNISRIFVLALAAAAAVFAAEQAATSAEATLSAAGPLEPGQRFSARLTFVNDQGTPAAWKATYSLQTDSRMFDAVPPDPLYGSDRALGTRSWTEADGKVIEEGSLTDGKDYTAAATPYLHDHFREAFQYVDLGRERKITRITYGSGDANHAWKLDLAASLDGKSYATVPDVQGFEMFKKWGNVALPLKQSLDARYLRLRHHKDGEKVALFAMPCRLSVYDGTAGETWELPRIGEVLGGGRKAIEAAAGASATVDLVIDRPLAPGLYLLAVRLERGAWRQLLYHRVLVLPEPMLKVAAESRFGINAANGEWAPILRRLGVGWVRFENLKWPFVSPEPGVYRFDGSVRPWQVKHDAIFKGYAEKGLNVLPFLFETAGYASSAAAGVKADRRAFYPPRDPRQFGEFAFQVAARYGDARHPAAALKTPDAKSALGYLHVYEIWNEPNLTDPKWGGWVGTSGQYLKMFRVAAEAVRRGDPAAKVTNAGFAGIQVKTVDQLRTYTYEDGKHPLDFTDILSVHFYSGRIPPEIATDDFNANQSGEIKAEDEFRRLAAWRDAHKPGMPIWLSETGYDSAGPYGTDEGTQAARLPRVVMLALANGMEKVFVYRESGSMASMHAASGLLRDDGSFKPSFLTYATLIRELDGVQGGAVRLPYADKNVRLYAWQRGGETILTAWTIEGDGKLDLDLGRATVTDAFGHRQGMDLSGGLALSPYPVYIRDVSDRRTLQGLQAQAQADEVRRNERRQRLADAEAYLFTCFHDPKPQRYELAARASLIDPRTRPHPEIGFVFEKNGKPADVEKASVDTRVQPQGKLVIWLMGYNAPLFERLNGYGLHAIQVHYANGWFDKLNKLAPPTDDQFLGNIRLEAATGKDFSKAVDIPQPDGMMERAAQFVKWLAKENPPGRWEYFLTDDRQGLRWDHVIMAGASHGATTAARFAKYQRVDRVVMFCGPRDQYETWQGLPSATPGNRFFAFSHVLDGGWTGHHYDRSWELLKLNEFGPIVNVDHAKPPYGNTRRLITAADVKNDARRAHSSVVPGGAAVKDAAGRFIHEDAWRYLFTQPVEQAGAPVPHDPGCPLDLRTTPLSLFQRNLP